MRSGYGTTNLNLINNEMVSDAVTLYDRELRHARKPVDTQNSKRIIEYIKYRASSQQTSLAFASESRKNRRELPVTP